MKNIIGFAIGIALALSILTASTAEATCVNRYPDQAQGHQPVPKCPQG